MTTIMDTLLEEMDRIWDKFIKCRSLFPYTPPNLIGTRKAYTAPYYRQFGFDVTFDFGVGLTSDDIAKINSVGHYINQNFLVRLYALLESFHIVSNVIKLDRSITTWEDMDILRRLRDKFAHTSGKYDPNDKDQKKLCDRITDHFKLENTDPPDFPLDIDKVLEPMVVACNAYVREFMEKNGPDSE